MNIGNPHKKRDEHGHSRLVPSFRVRMTSPNRGMPGEGDSPEGGEAGEQAPLCCRPTQILVWNIRRAGTPIWLKFPPRRPKSFCKKFVSFLVAIHVNRADQANSVPVLEEQEGAKYNPKLKALLDELLDLFLEELPKYLPHEMAVDH